MKYIQRIQGAIAITKVSDISNVLRMLVGNPDIIIKNSTLTNVYAHRYHEIISVRRRLQKDFGI